MATDVQRDHICLSITDDQPPPQPATPTTVERSTSRCNPRFVAGFLKDHIKISLFLCFNSILPLTDVFTDSLTSFELYDNGHVLWSTMTFVLMWNPFIVHLLAFLFKFSRSSRQQFDAIEELKHLVFFLPFVTPVKNIYYTIRLYTLRFGMQDFEAKNAKEVERIQDQAGSAGMYESFLESGPQCVVQMKIILSTGTYSTAQIVSLHISVFSLAWAASRAYFIQRDEDNSDPDPELKMVAMRIFPWILIVVVHSLTVWTCIAGLLGKFVIPSILIYFCAAYGLLIFANAWNITRVLCRTIVSALLLFSLLITFFCIFPFMLPFILPPVTVLVIFCYTLAGASHEGEIQPEKKY